MSWEMSRSQFSVASDSQMGSSGSFESWPRHCTSRASIQQRGRLGSRVPIHATNWSKRVYQASMMRPMGVCVIFGGVNSWLMISNAAFWWPIRFTQSPKYSCICFVNAGSVQQSSGPRVRTSTVANCRIVRRVPKLCFSSFFKSSKSSVTACV